MTSVDHGVETPPPRASRAPAGTGGTGRRDDARCGAVQALLEGHDVLVDRAADDLPAGLRAGVRVAGQERRPRQVRRVRGHRGGRHRGPVLLRVSGDVQHLHPLAVPADLRRAAGRAGRRGGARHRRDPVDLAARRRLRPGAAARGLRLRPQADGRNAAGAVHRLRHRVGLRRLRRPDRRHGQDDRQLQLHHQRRADADVPGRGHVLPDLHAARRCSARSPSSTRSITACSSSATPRSESSSPPTWSRRRCCWLSRC